jgi:sodium-dependent dicarboxylate transporter 2/3/5
VHLPIALSVLHAARDRGVPEPELKRLGAAVMLAISYAASIGGMATLVGTPPNLAYRGALGDLFPHAPSPSFLQWMMVGTPLAAVFIALGYLALTRIVFRIRGEALLGSREAVTALRRELGPMRRDEVLVASIFGLTALLWMTQALWAPLLRARGAHVDDSVIAIAAALTLFVLPSRDRPGERLLAWRETARLPWGTLLVFGGGFALASGFEASGLSAWLGDRFGALHGTPPRLHMAVLCLAMIVFTEFASNTAATAMALPIVASAAVAAGTDPRYLMIPATFAASCGFMMPVGSPTQTIVFGSGWVPMRDMIRAGIWFNLIGFILIPLLFMLLAGAAMGIEEGILPPWATP